ncbi:flagellin N-terminal helical domain-containing protein [Crateriforma conspicua]|uniref:Flagellar hook-associated protein FlgL n=1 Tax=Crateriforma conspicua TaxID=2527996 RepID=A0A5C5Y6F3_9PLAN|nr:flagellin hook IN motif-containing protein [Crateriforma conspicua]QDV65330.1 flagellar hook-associated protein FlgL [Crateriforma conspicua]TWT70724.1 flagellar hook-associated protein FlgL [Crateriforma conspicua]
MAILPVNTTRTSTPLATQRLLFQLNADQVELQRTYDQLSTGRRVLRVSDDPASAGRALVLQRGIDRTDQLQRNAQATEAFYQSTDDALARIDDALIQARGVAVEAAQNVLSEDERAALSATVQQALNSVFTAGNVMFRDHQLLGGILESENALNWIDGGVHFSGTEAVGNTKLGGGVSTAINVSASESLGLLSTVVTGDSLGAGLARDTRLVDMKAGKGVQPGIIRVSDGGNFQTIDLSRAATIGDVEDIIDQYDLNGRRLSFSITNDTVRLEYSDGLPGTLAVDDVPGGTTASDLGLSNPQGFTAPPLTGTGMAPRVTTETRIDQLADGAGLDLTGGLQISRGGQDFDIDLSEAETLGDVLIAINRSDADVQAELDQSAGRIVLKAQRSGVDYSIGENGGVAASSLGIRSSDEQTRLSELGGGRGLVLNSQDDDLVITRPDGVQLGINLEGAETIQDVIDLISNHPDNQDSLRVLVRLNAVGNGLELEAPPGAGNLEVSQPGLSDAGSQLGLIPDGETVGTGELSGGSMRLVGGDYDPQEAGGALDTLIRLQRAVLDGDVEEISLLQERLDVDLDRSSRTRGRVGVWSQNLQQLSEANAQESLLLQSQLSDEIDADLATVISEMTSRQTALEASMRLIGQTSQITVLNYL